MALQTEYLYSNSAPETDHITVEDASTAGAAATYALSPSYACVVTGIYGVVTAAGDTGDWSITITEETNSETLGTISDAIADDAVGDKLTGTVASTPYVIPANSVIKFTEDAGNSSANGTATIRIAVARVELAA